MGNKESKQHTVCKLDWNEWQSVATHRQSGQIMSNTRGKGEAQLYTIPTLPNRSHDKQLEIYEYRQTQDNALVRCLGAQLKKEKSQSFCGNNDHFKVLTERIPKRWNQLPQITHPEAIYALCESLRGYRQCYGKIGSFEVTDQMIGVNPMGEVKVWLNEDFGQNHPTFEKPVLQTTGGLQNQGVFSGSKDESEMVRNIISIIERKNQNGAFPQDLKYLLNEKSYSFDSTLKELEQYSVSKGIFVPDRLMQFSNRSVLNTNGESYFTPGEQYQRHSSDPLYRQPNRNFQGSSNAYQNFPPPNHLPQNSHPQILHSPRESNPQVFSQRVYQPQSIFSDNQAHFNMSNSTVYQSVPPSTYSYMRQY